DPLGKGITIENLIHLVDSDVDVPLSIALKDAVFIYDRRSGRTTYLFGVDIDGGIDLAALPLVGKVLPSDAGLTYRLQPLVALGTPDTAGVYFAADELTRLGALLPG